MSAAPMPTTADKTWKIVETGFISVKKFIVSMRWDYNTTFDFI